MPAVAEKPNKKKPIANSEPPEKTGDEEWLVRSVRFPPELYERIGNEADAARRSTQLQVIWMLEEFYRLKAEVERLRKASQPPAE